MNFESEILKITAKKLSKNDLLIWLENNLENFRLIQNSSLCSKRVLPCFCCERQKECLFFEIYVELSKTAKYFELCEVLEKQLAEFKNIENNAVEVREWLVRNLHMGLNDLWFFMSPNYSDYIVGFANGKKNDRFEYLRIKINGKEFKSIYNFANLFATLFFEDKILIKEMEKWKYENHFLE